MNHKLWTSVGARVLAAAFIIAGVAACERHVDADADGLPSSASPSAQLIGTVPAEPSGDPPGTTPVDKDTNEVSKAVQNQSMPLPGQPNDHSNEASKPSQNAQGADAIKSPAAAAGANSGKSASERTQ